MEKDSTNKFFASLVTISFIVCILTVIYIIFELGKEPESIKGASDASISSYLEGDIRP